MSWEHHIIWTDGEVFMVAKGDRTDEYFETIEEAMDWIDKLEEENAKRREAR